MDLHVTFDGPGDADTRVARIYQAVREAVLDGRLEPGERVPATRDLAAQLGVARGTVGASYERLVAEGFLETRPGSGTYVTGVEPRAKQPPRQARAGAVRPLPVWQPPVVETGPRQRLLHDLSIGLPDPAVFPLETWRRLVSQQLRRSRLEETTYTGAGSLRLQREIARHLALSRSVACSEDDVVVTAGAQQAIDLVARVLLAPGALVAVEDPGYDAVHRLLETHRADVRGVPVDREGLVVDALPAQARVVYVTPSHQFPTGVQMSLSRRIALLQWAIDHDAVVIEDDYDSEFRYATQPVEPLQSLDRDGRVAYVGTFSKSLLPALRTGFVVPPRTLLPAVREAKRVTTWEGDLTTQGALAQFLADGHHSAHVRRATRVYRERRTLVLESLARVDEVETVPSVAGLHVCARFLDPHVDDRAVAARAALRGVRVEPLSARFRDVAPVSGLSLGFGGIAAEAVPDAMGRLAQAISHQH